MGAQLAEDPERTGRARYRAGVALAFAAAWALGTWLGPYDTGDSGQYLWQAVNLEAGRPPYAGDWAAPRDSVRFSLRPPGYAALVVAARAASEDPRWLAALQSVLGAATWFLVWTILERAGTERRAGPLWLGLVATPATLVYAQVAMADTAFTALVVAALWRWTVFADTGRAREVVAANALVAAALWVKPVVLYVWPGTLALSAWALWRRGRRGAALAPALSAGLVPLAAAGLVALNVGWTGSAEVSSIQTLNLVEYNAQRTLARTGEPEVYDRAAARSAQIPGYAERQRWRRDWALGVIADRPGPYAAIHATGVAAFFLDPGRFDLALFLRLDSPGGGMRAGSQRGAGGVASVLARQPPALLAALAVLFAVNAAVAVAFAAWVVWARAPVEVRLAAFGLVAYLALVAGPVGSARYRLAAAPILALSLPWAAAALRQRLDARRRLA